LHFLVKNAEPSTTNKGDNNHIEDIGYITNWPSLEKIISQAHDKISKISSVTFLALTWVVNIQNFSPIGLKLRDEFEMTDDRQHAKIYHSKIITSPLNCFAYLFILISLKLKLNLKKILWNFFHQGLFRELSLLDLVGDSLKLSVLFAWSSERKCHQTKSFLVSDNL